MIKKDISDLDISRSILLEIAFLDYCRFTYITDADIELLYARVEQIKKDFEENKESALEPMLKYDLENINSKEDLKRRIQEQKAKIASTIVNSTQIETTDNAEGFIKNYLKNLGFSKDAEILTKALLEQTLQESYNEKQTKADRLGALLVSQNKVLKENLFKHFNAYQEKGLHHTLVENLREDVEGYVLGIQQKTTFNFRVKPEDKDLRDLLREDFNAPDGVKVAFLKVYGRLMEAGRDIMENKDPSASYIQFEKEMKAYFGSSYEEEICQALDTENLKEAREKFYIKAQNLYIKNVAALLSKKKEFDREHRIYNTNYGDYLKVAINQTYINGLVKGRNMVSSLGLVDEIGPDAALSRSEEFKYNRELLGDMTDNQHISVHHKIPIGSVKDIIFRLLGPKKIDELRKLASSMVNTFGNMEVVIGREKHQSLEPRDQVVLYSKPNRTIFEARLNPDCMKEICRDTRISEKIRSALKKYEKGGDIFEAMNFSESPLISKIRPQQNVNPNVRTIFDKFIKYFNR